jgi:hypothetical protein
VRKKTRLKLLPLKRHLSPSKRPKLKKSAGRRKRMLNASDVKKRKPASNKKSRKGWN